MLKITQMMKYDSKYFILSLYDIKLFICHLIILFIYVKSLKYDSKFILKFNNPIWASSSPPIMIII